MQIPLRRGLPRVTGGEPWPPAGTVVDLDLSAEEADPTPDIPAPAAAPADAGGAELTTVPVRRGLPRVPGGAPWPPVSETRVALAHAKSRETEPEPEPEPQPAPAPQPAAQTPPAPQPREMPAPAQPPAPRRDWLRWVAGAVGVGFALAFCVLLARAIAATGWGADFLARYDGVQPLPADAPVGLPAWLNWAHFFNMFLMALIVSTGISVRTQRRPAAFWAPKNNPRAKISLTLWIHLVVDVAWVALGAVFYVLLFTTGQWVRIVPTSWETIPNAVSAGLQYLTLDWPLDNGWAHYNALQELTYFAVVFVAAPLAILSGARMSPWWPKGVNVISIKAARAIHFPTMIFFVGFTVVHVALVVLTGMRRNLNAMFAARGSLDPAAFASDWTGTFVFAGALAVTALAVAAARPALVAPLARATGTVSNR